MSDSKNSNQQPQVQPIPVPNELYWLNKEIHRLTRSQNMPRRIELCRQALTLVEREHASELWASYHAQLAYSFDNNPLGSRADNLEQAIYHYEQGLEVYTQQAYPEDWAMIQNNLAVVYGNRIRGERGNNLEQSIFHAKQALKIRTRQALPHLWAKTQTNLAIAYRNRIKGERSKNIELAIKHFQQALEVHTRQAFPEKWALAQNNLANAYLYRIRGKRDDNLELAIYHYKQALEVRTRPAFPLDWADTQNNLATAYLYKREQSNNLEQAISLYKQVLEVRTRQAFPKHWADIQNNLCETYRYRVRGERGDNLEWAIFYAKQALEVYKPQSFPQDWAEIQNNLANALFSRIRGKRSKNLEQAIYHYEQALEILTAQNFPQKCRDTAYRLGGLLYGEGHFAEARKAFAIAHEAVEALRGEVVREGARRKLGEENANLYAQLVFCCLHDANTDEEAAFEYAAAGKGRAFVDMLATTRFDLSAVGADEPELAADWLKYRELRFSIDNLRTRLSGRGTEIDEQLRKQESELLRNLQRQELELWEDLTYKYPALTATQSAPSLIKEGAQALASDLGATLVEFVQHAGGWSAFVVTSEAVRHVPLPDVDDEFLQEMVIEWLVKIGQPKFHNQESYWTLDEWHEALIMPLKPHLPPSGKVVLAPAGALHLIPLTIARHPDTLAYLCDEYALSFAPSLAALRVTLEEAKKKGAAKDESGTLLAVAYPGQLDQPNYLSHAIAETEAIETHFTNVTRLYLEDATPQAVVEKAKGQSVAHFSCHGTFDSDLPSQSGLLLHDGFLTVQRIITELRLSNARLATLSACVTHQADVRAGEEHVGLVQSVLTAGAQSVVASLWSVPEDSTRVLFEHFYRAVANGEPPASALQQAMQHVRQQTSWEHPFYWAAFQVSGLGYDLQ